MRLHLKLYNNKTDIDKKEKIYWKTQITKLTQEIAKKKIEETAAILIVVFQLKKWNFSSTPPKPI